MIRNTISLAVLSIAFSAPILAAEPRISSQQQIPAVNVPRNTAIQYVGFIAFGRELQDLRESRRIPVSQFVTMSQDANTIVLDTRSKAAYDAVHVSGAIHLNFSDFTDDKLLKTIPSKQTRILIYCNNNFVDDAESPNDEANAKITRTKEDQPDVLEGFTDKRPRFALNIPTFINLHGYGYKNVYELADRLRVSDARLRLEGKSINTNDN